jgi:hypothetical protein
MCSPNCGTSSTVHASSSHGAIRRIAMLASRGSQQLTLAEAEEENTGMH